jgi:nucleoside-diphosphate-sugar epimerase
VRVLVTGVSGFVGGALGRYLRARGYGVTGVSRGAARSGACCEFVPFDLTTGVVPGRFDAVVHCAARSAPWGRPAEFVAQNVRATANTLRVEADHFVFVSSSSVYYRWGDQWGLTEESPVAERPLNAYAATKLEAERLVRASGRRWTVVRPRAVFGPEDTVLFPRLLRAAKKGMLPRFGEREPVGDLIYIENLCFLLERVLALGATGDFNVTNGEPVGLWTFLNEVFRGLGYPELGRRVPVGVAMGLARGMEMASAATGWWEPPITRFGVEVMAHAKTFDVGKANAVLGRVPVSNAESLRRFVEWQSRFI